MAFGSDDVRQVAHLARLGLNDDDIQEYAHSLSSVLDLIEQMQSVDTTGVEPLAHPLALTQRLREDSVTESNRREHYQHIAPTVENGLYLVPKVIE